jgi:hypothetical protein
MMDSGDARRRHPTVANIAVLWTPDTRSGGPRQHGDGSLRTSHKSTTRAGEGRRSWPETDVGRGTEVLPSAPTGPTGMR